MHSPIDKTTLQIAIVAVTIVIFFWLTGCSTPPVQTITVEKPVEIPGPITYVPIPANLFAGCDPPAAPGPTNGDLLEHDNALLEYAQCLSDHLAVIKNLK